IGRSISRDDDTPTASTVAVLSHGLWQRRFGGNPGILGQKVLVNGAACEIIGVMPPGFAVPTQAADVYMPMQIRGVNLRARNFRTIARLKPEVSLAAAQADMQAIAAQLS